jgi:hypothetical protein
VRFEADSFEYKKELRFAALKRPNNNKTIKRDFFIKDIKTNKRSIFIFVFLGLS